MKCTATPNHRSSVLFGLSQAYEVCTYCSTPPLALLSHLRQGSRRLLSGAPSCSQKLTALGPRSSSLSSARCRTLRRSQVAAGRSLDAVDQCARRTRPCRPGTPPPNHPGGTEAAPSPMDTHTRLRQSRLRSPVPAKTTQSTPAHSGNATKATHLLPSLDAPEDDAQAESLLHFVRAVLIQHTLKHLGSPCAEAPYRLTPVVSAKKCCCGAHCERVVESRNMNIRNTLCRCAHQTMRVHCSRPEEVRQFVDRTQIGSASLRRCLLCGHGAAGIARGVRRLGRRWDALCNATRWL